MLNKSVKEIIKILQSSSLPGKKSKTLWEELKEQAMQAGTWDAKLLEAIEKVISDHLSFIKESKLREMWEMTEPGMESFEETDGIPLTKIKTDLVNELLSLVMDKLDSSGDYVEDLSHTKFMDDDGFEDDFGFDEPVGLDDDLF